MSKKCSASTDSEVNLIQIPSDSILSIGQEVEHITQSTMKRRPSKTWLERKKFAAGSVSLKRSLEILLSLLAVVQAPWSIFIWNVSRSGSKVRNTKRRRRTSTLTSGGVSNVRFASRFIMMLLRCQTGKRCRSWDLMFILMRTSIWFLSRWPTVRPRPFT